jgi:hypothetical protein
MSLFVEVNSIDKGCKIIINLDSVIEIAPLAAGGCALFVSDSASTGGKTAIKVSDSYELFKQFAMQTVSSDDIANRIEKITRGRGRPPKAVASPATDQTEGNGYVGGEHPGVTW